MLKRKALALSLGALVWSALSCGEPVGLPKTGGISIALVSENGASLSVVPPGSANASVELEPGASPPSNVTLTSVRVTVSGPTNKQITNSTPSGGFFAISVDGLAPGSYSVTVEGLVNGEVAHLGQVSGVAVTAGASSQATVTFPSFTPVIPLAAVTDTSDLLRFTVSYGAVTGATAYIVAWSANADMSGASSKNVTGTSTEVVVTAEGKYYVTVKAVNNVVPNGGAPSAPKGVFVFQGVATVTVTPATPNIAAGATQQMTAEAKDGDNNVVPNVSWFWASSNHTVATVSQTGLVTGVGGGTATITAVGKGMPGNATVTVGNAVGSKLAFSVQPASTIAGDALSPAVQVEIQDASGNRITTARDAVTIAFGANPGSGTLTGTKVVNAINGIASFTGLWVNKAASGYTLSASSGSLTAATSSGFNVTPAAPAKLSFSAQPTNAYANASIAPPVTVTIADLFDNAVTTATNDVTVSLGANPWKTPFATGATLSGTQTVAAVGGVATFNNLKIDKPAPGYTLAGSAGALTGAASVGFSARMPVGQLGAGWQHTCAVSIGGAFCWGYNGNGQLGAVTGNTGTDSIAALVRGGLSFVSTTGGYDHSCGLTAAGAAWCWGYNGNGQLGNNSTTQSDVPVAVVVPSGLVFAQIDAGGSHTCGVTTASGTAAIDRQVYCWGYNGQGQIGDASNTQRLVPTRVVEPLQTTTRASQVSAGANHTCARAINGNIYCWGYNYNGQLGDGAALINGGQGAPRTAPFAVVGGFLWTSVSTGSSHTCGVTASNTMRCWGYNGNGQLGDQTNTSTSSTVLVFGGLTNWGAVTTGGSHTCGIAGTTAYCWGYNGNGELGDDNAPTSTNQPVTVAGGLSFLEIAAGANHACGRTTGAGNTAAYCWGANYNGQLGSPGTSGIKKAPVQIIQ